MGDEAELEERALAWLYVEIKELLRELGRAGMSPDAQSEVATNYLFGMTCRLDGAEEAGGVTLAFIDGNEEHPDAVHLVRPSVSMHSCVDGTVADLLGR